MDLSLRNELVKVPDLRHQVRRLRWFRESFRRILSQVAADNGLSVDVDATRLTEAFLNWMEKLGQQKAYAAVDRKDFASFAAGLLLQELLRSAPVSSHRLQPAAETGLPSTQTSPIADFWPEGFLYTSYCLCVLNAVFEQEFKHPLEIAPNADNLRTWWSFRENTSEDPSLAIGFLDSFLGNEPNWTTPFSAQERPAMRHSREEQAAAALNEP